MPKSPTPKPDRQLSFRLTPDQHAWLSWFTIKEGRTIGDIMLEQTRNAYTAAKAKHPNMPTVPEWETTAKAPPKR